MGTDYSTNEAVVATVEDMAKIVNGKNKEAVIQVVQKFSDKAKGKAKELFGQLSKKSKISDVREPLVDFVKVTGEPGKYEGNCRFAHVDQFELCELWEDIIRASGANLPPLVEVMIFDSYRKHDMCPIGVASFIFNRDGVYESKLSEGGQNLKRLCGYINEVSWTDVSY